MNDFYNIKWTDKGLMAIDQRLLPIETKYMLLTTDKEVFDAIKCLAIRGAGVLSNAAAYGVYLGIWKKEYSDDDQVAEDICAVAEYMKTCRPTAISLSVLMDQIIMLARKNEEAPAESQKLSLLEECHRLVKESLEIDSRAGENALSLFKDGDTVITHCNTGIYASVGFGSALAPIYLGKQRGINIKVYADETRPILQGSRLTAHELQQFGVDVTVICDNMAGYLMQQKKIDAVIVGCDRIAANGDVINKIGTYSLAVLAKHHGIPFYVVGAFEDVDFTTANGSDIPIEERPAEEVTEGFGKRTAPYGVKVYNPAFDATPWELVTALVLDTGTLYPPYKEKLLLVKALEDLE